MKFYLNAEDALMNNDIFYDKKLIDSSFKVVEIFIKRILKIKTQKEFKSIKACIDDYSFSKEFKTLRISLPRRSGNTTLALMIFQKYPSSIFITNTEYMIKADQRLKFLDKSRVFSKGRYHFNGISASIVIVDISTWLSYADLKKIYSINCDMLIFIG
jgi:hypothetical protein